MCFFKVKHTFGHVSGMVEISRSKSEIALSQEWYGRLTWNEKYVSHPFMTMMLTSSLGYLLIYPPQIATVMKPVSFCSKYNPVSHTKSLGESWEWNMVFQGNI